MPHKLNTPNIIDVSICGNENHIEKSISATITWWKAEVIIDWTMQKIQFIIKSRNFNFTHTHPKIWILEPNDNTLIWYSNLVKALEIITQTEQYETSKIIDKTSELEQINKIPAELIVKLLTLGNRFRIPWYNKKITNIENSIFFFDKIFLDIQTRIQKYNSLAEKIDNDEDIKNIQLILKKIEYELSLLIKALKNRTRALKDIISLIEST